MPFFDVPSREFDVGTGHVKHNALLKDLVGFLNCMGLMRVKRSESEHIRRQPRRRNCRSVENSHKGSD